jgi:hypothetical protein
MDLMSDVLMCYNLLVACRHMCQSMLCFGLMWSKVRQCAYNPEQNLIAFQAMTPYQLLLNGGPSPHVSIHAVFWTDVVKSLAVCCQL